MFGLFLLWIRLLLGNAKASDKDPKFRRPEKSTIHSSPWESAKTPGGSADAAKTQRFFDFQSIHGLFKGYIGPTS